MSKLAKNSQKTADDSQKQSKKADDDSQEQSKIAEMPILKENSQK